jgi:hypothetical protein
MANQMGWIIECPVTFWAEWNGNSNHVNAIRFGFHECDHPSVHTRIISQFGSGIITFSMPWLFRTLPPEGQTWEQCGGPNGLMVRGLPNHCKFNCHPLEGYVETWHLNFTFTMNWKITEPNIPVLFEKDEPICFLHPCSIGTLDQTAPVIEQMPPQVADEFEKWKRSRGAFNADPFRRPEEWQKNYMRSQDPGHRTHIALKSFKELSQ